MSRSITLLAAGTKTSQSTNGSRGNRRLRMRATGVQIAVRRGLRHRVRTWNETSDRGLRCDRRASQARAGMVATSTAVAGLITMTRTPTRSGSQSSTPSGRPAGLRWLTDGPTLASAGVATAGDRKTLGPIVLAGRSGQTAAVDRWPIVAVARYGLMRAGALGMRRAIVAAVHRDPTTPAVWWLIVAAVRGDRVAAVVE